MESASLSSESAEKSRSFSVLNTLYHETRQEIVLLNKQICVKDKLIADLKNRLGRHERIYMTMGSDEPVPIGPSSSLVESLLKEICKLKQNRNEVEIKAGRQAEEIQRLNLQLREKELELDTIRCQPDHEKDQEIQRLSAALKEKERTEATRAVLCTSLAEEADQLRGRLEATVRVCTELLARLEPDNKLEFGGKGALEVSRLEKALEQPEASDLTRVKSQIGQLQEENRQLKQRVAYVQDLNSQWQKYDSSREDYVRSLCQRLKESSTPGLMPAMGSFRTGLLHQEISRLNALLEEKIRECSQLDRDAEQLRRHGQERIQTLEQQVLIYTEDFKSERADRERAQGQIGDLKEQISQLKQQLQKQQGTNRESRDAGPLCRVHIGHRIASRRSKDSSGAPLRASVERQQQPAPAQPAAAAAAANLNEYRGSSELQCPQCHARFNDTEAVECMKHFDECARL